MNGTNGYRLRVVVWAVAAASVCLPAIVAGDIIRLKDGSTMKGNVLSLVGDTLTIRTSFGATLRVPRASIALVSFTDSLPPTAGSRAAPLPASAAKEAGRTDGVGKIGVTFVDTKLSSKIEVERRKDEEGHLRANWIEVKLIVDDAEAYSSVDTTMDKTIHKGPIRVYKNTIKLEDFEVDVPAGFHHAALVVRNVGIDEYEDAFEDDPLEMHLNLDNLQVSAGGTLRVKVGITRGKLRLGKARFTRVE